MTTITIAIPEVIAATAGHAMLDAARELARQIASITRSEASPEAALFVEAWGKDTKQDDRRAQVVALCEASYRLIGDTRHSSEDNAAYMIREATEALDNACADVARIEAELARLRRDMPDTFADDDDFKAAVARHQQAQMRQSYLCRD